MPDARPVPAPDEIRAALQGFCRGRGADADVPVGEDLRAAGILDSLGIVDLALFVETEFGRRLPPRLLDPAAVLSLGVLAAEIATARMTSEATGPVLTVAHMASCVLAETLRIEPRPGGYDGFASVLRARCGGGQQLRVLAHPRVRWDELVDDDPADEAGPPVEVAALLGDRRFHPRRLAGADVVVLDLVHESYLWRLARAPRGSVDLAAPYVSAADPAAVTWLNTAVRAEGPLALEDLEPTLERALPVIVRAADAPIILVGGLWHRPRTHFTTAYTGSTFDSALRRYLLSNGLTSPDAFYARLAGIDAVGRRVAERAGVTWLDGRATLADQASFTDPIHLNDLGWDALARALVEHMIALGLVAPRHPPHPTATHFRSIGARATLAVEQNLEVRAETSIPIRDVCTADVGLLQPSDRLVTRLAAVANRVAAAPPRRLLLWGLGALGARLAAAVRARDVAVVVHEGPFLIAGEPECRSGDLVVAAVRDMSFGPSWVACQAGAASVEIVDLEDVPPAFAPGAEGDAATRARCGFALACVQRAIATAASPARVAVCGEVAPVRAAWRHAGLGVEPTWRGIAGGEGVPPFPADVIVCVGPDASSLVARLRATAAPGSRIIDPDVDWLAAAGAGPVVVPAGGRGASATPETDTGTPARHSPRMIAIAPGGHP